VPSARPEQESNTCSTSRFDVPIYVLRYAAVGRKRVERLVDPYLFRTSEVQRREVAGEFELRAADRELMRRLWQVTGSLVRDHAIEPSDEPY
jgi:hypothetical protein